MNGAVLGCLPQLIAVPICLLVFALMWAVLTTDQWEVFKEEIYNA